MKYKKYIFDLDYTLLIPDWSMEDEYLKRYIHQDEQEIFFRNKQYILSKYEFEYPKYDLKTLSIFFKSYGISISEEVIRGWMLFNGENIIDKVADGAKDLFDYLKENEVVRINNFKVINNKVIVLSDIGNVLILPDYSNAKKSLLNKMKIKFKEFFGESEEEEKEESNKENDNKENKNKENNISIKNNKDNQLIEGKMVIDK